MYLAFPAIRRKLKTLPTPKKIWLANGELLTALRYYFEKKGVRLELGLGSDWREIFCSQYHEELFPFVMGRSKKKSRVSLDVSTSQQQLKQSNCYEGEQLISLLKSIHKELESAKLLKGAFPEKIWIKQQFSIGVNDVTRVLERMPPTVSCEKAVQDSNVESVGFQNSSVQLQAVILASDCNPRWLTKHIPSLASSRKVPIITVKDKKGGSLRLGQLVNLKTAIAIGVKANGSGINKLMADILDKMENVDDTEPCQVG